MASHKNPIKKAAANYGRTSEDQRRASENIAMVVLVFAKTEHTAAAYIAALTVNFFTLAFAFVIALDVILQQSTDTVSPTLLTPADDVIE